MVASNPWHSSACRYLTPVSPFTLYVLFSMCVSLSPNFLLKEKKSQPLLNVLQCCFYSFFVCGHEILLPFIWGGLVAKLYLTLWDPMDCSLPGPSVHGTSQTRILEWVAISFSRVLLFYVFGPKACGILAPQPGIELTPPALEGEVLTSGLPGKSQIFPFSGTAVIL